MVPKMNRPVITSRVMQQALFMKSCKINDVICSETSDRACPRRNQWKVRNLLKSKAVLIYAPRKDTAPCVRSKAAWGFGVSICLAPQPLSQAEDETALKTRLVSRPISGSGPVL